MPRRPTTDTPMALDALLNRFGGPEPAGEATAWLRDLRARLARDRSDPRALGDLRGARFESFCRSLGLDPQDARERLLRSLPEAEAGSAPAPSPPARDRGGRGRSASRLLLATALAAAGGLALWLLPVKSWLLAALDWTRAMGAWGAALFVPLYVVATVLMVPGSLLTLGAGFLFGVVRGTLLVSLASTLGASAAFLLGRTLARGWVEAKIARNPRFAAIDRAVGREGFKVVLLVRLSPVFPFVLQNYAFGLTGVRFRSYLLASWLGMLPGTVLYVALGAAAKSLAELSAGGPAGAGSAARMALLAAGLAATAAVTVTVTRLARRALREEIALGTDGASAAAHLSPEP